MAQRLALIIGNSVYLDGTLSRLLAPDADVGALGELLLDPERGGFDDVKVMVNMSSHIIRRAIASFYSKRTREDLLLLYFSGHGVLDDQGQLFLAVRDTDSRLLSGSAIPANYITTEMNNSHSQRQVLILDCCHSGAFARGSKSMIGASVGTGAVFEGTGFGRVVLTASDATQYAWEGEQVIGRTENSLFTHYLVEGIQTGKADIDADGQITVDELYDYTYDQVVHQTPRQTPGKWSYKEQGELVLARVPSPTSTGSRQVKIPELDVDHEQRLDQLYNEGLSAFWLEEWDNAVRCLEALVELRGDYRDAVHKLELSRQNKRLLALYNQAVAADEAGEWAQAIARLEEIISTAPAYKDAAVRLEKARGARELNNLYQEARQLSQAAKWQAVVNVFTKINKLQPDHPDPEGLLATARLKVAESERRQKMDNLHRRALQEMNASNWEKARQLLVELERMEKGYQGADRLLAKCEATIAAQQAMQQRAERIAGLYDQAKVLVNTRQWAQARQKMGEIRELEPGFEDPEGIDTKAQAEIEGQQAEAQRLLELNALYTQAVQLLEAGQYQQALEQWGRVQALDLAYPDRQKVQATATKKLKELTQVRGPKRRLPRWAYAAISLGVVAVLAVVLILTYPEWGKGYTVAVTATRVSGAISGSSRATATRTPRPGSSRPTATRTHYPVSTQRPTITRTRVPVSTLRSTIVFPISDNFNNAQYDGSYNPDLWSLYNDCPSSAITQQNGIMVLSGENRTGYQDVGISLLAAQELPLSRSYSLQARVMVDVSAFGAHLGVNFHLPDGYALCQVQTGTHDVISCWTSFFDDDQDMYRREITPGTWHTIRIDLISLDPVEFDFYIDEVFIGTAQPRNAGNTTSIHDVSIHLLSYTEKASHGYIDDFSFGPLP